MANLKNTSVPVPSNGMCTVGQPGRLPNRTSPRVRNFLVHTQNKLQMRGPVQGNFANAETPTTYENNLLVGSWNFDTNILQGFAKKPVAGEHRFPPWVSPYFFVVGTDLMVPTEKIQFFKTGNGASTSSITTSFVPMGRGTRLGKYVWGPAFSGGSVVESPPLHNQQLRPLIKWDGTSTAPVEVVAAPVGSQAAVTFLNRLWVLGGSSTSSVSYPEWSWSAKATTSPIEIPYSAGAEKFLQTTAAIGDEITGTGLKAGSTVVRGEFNPVTRMYRLFLSLEKESATGTNIAITSKHVAGINSSQLSWSVENGPLSGTEADWKDPNSGLLNKIVVGSDDQNDFGVALAVVNKSLVIFKRNSVWAMYGSSPETFQIRNLTQERGCLDPASVCEIDGGVIFASQNGIEMWDGSEFRSLDGQISSLTRAYINAAAGNSNYKSESTYGRISIAYAGNNYIFVSFATHNVSTFEQLSGWNGMMHLQTNNWTEFTSPALQGSLADYCSYQAKTLVLFDGKFSVTCPYLTNGDGNEFGSVVYNLVDKNSGGGELAIPSEFWTDRIDYASPPYKSQNHRVMLDYNYRTSAGDEEAATHNATVSLVGDQNEVLMSGNLPAAGGVTTKYVNGRRFEQDVFTETISAVLKVSYTDAARANRFEVYDGMIEAQQSSQRRSV